HRRLPCPVLPRRVVLPADRLLLDVPGRRPGAPAGDRAEQAVPAGPAAAVPAPPTARPRPAGHRAPRPALAGLAGARRAGRWGLAGAPGPGVAGTGRRPGQPGRSPAPPSSAPVSMVGGWHDFFLPLQLRDYAALRQAGQDPYLLIGPWRHADQESVQAWAGETLAWMRAHLAGDEDALRRDPVRIFVTGVDEW